MPIGKLAERLEQDVSRLHWQSQIHNLSPAEVLNRYDKLVGSYRTVVAPEDLVVLDQLLKKHASTLLDV